MGDSYQIKDQGGVYFITCQVVGWVAIFSRKVYRDIVSLKYCIENKGLIVYSYVIMTNHLHMVIGSETNSLSDTVRDFKRFTAIPTIFFIFKSGKGSCGMTSALS
jgi:REP element-mobilizing transposase RayT